MNWRIALLVLGSFQLTLGQKCYGLSLEGGGSRGAFEAGAIWELVNNLPADEVRWNIITGISTGALNTGGLGNYAYGEEVQAAQFILDMWSTIEQKDIYKNWPIPGEGFFTKSGIYNNEPLKTLVHEIMVAPKRNVTVGATNLDTGLFTRFDETFGDIKSAIIASSSAPFYFPTLKMNSTTYSDGGILINLDIFAAIERCQQIAQDSDIYIDMIFLQPPILEPVKVEKTWIVEDVENRVEELKKYYHLGWYLIAAKAAHKEVNFRYVIQPESSLPGGIVPLDFDRKSLDESIEKGKVQAQKAIENYKVTKESKLPSVKNLSSRIYARE